MPTVYNARITLLATTLNNLGVGAIIAGSVAPMVNGRVGDLAHVTAWIILGVDVICLAQVVLGRLQPS